MGLECADHIWLHFVFHALAAEVLVEHAGPAADGILLVLVIVLLQVVNDSATHVSVVLPWAKSREHVGSGLLVEVGTEQPAGGEDDPEEQEDEGDTLLGILDEG